MREIVKIVVVDDHLLVSESLRDSLKRNSKIKVIGIAANGVELLRLLNKVQADLILLDMAMPEMDGGTVLPILRKKYPALKILVMSSYDDGAYVNNAIKNGANGYILKTAPAKELVQSIFRVVRGERVLSMHLAELMIDHGLKKSHDINIKNLKVTRREMDVLRCISKGFTSREISKQLYIAESTVITHRKNLFKKFGVPNSANLVRVAMNADIID